MKAIVLAILPGRTEAWRRFLQELNGSRRSQFAEWCVQRQIGQPQISLIENGGSSWAIIFFNDSPDRPIQQALDREQMPFTRWLQRQTLALHGVDLANFSGQCRSFKEAPARHESALPIKKDRYC